MKGSLWTWSSFKSLLLLWWLLLLLLLLFLFFFFLHRPKLSTTYESMSQKHEIHNLKKKKQ